MTKQELANRQSGDVRHNAVLFDLFQKYLLEDWGQIPPGCFGCDFQKHFTAWAKPYKEQTHVEQKKLEIMNTGYVLVDSEFKTYFKGEVLSKRSSAAQWAKFINDDPKKVEARKKHFRQLPEGAGSDTEIEAGKAAVNADNEAKKNGSQRLVVVKNDSIDLDAMTKAELVEFAKVNDLNIGSLTTKNSKPELLDAIEKAALEQGATIEGAEGAEGAEGNEDDLL